MQGAMGDRLCWYPLAHRLHVIPVTPSLQGHCPVVWLQVRPDAPTGWHSHSNSPRNRRNHPENERENTHTQTHTRTALDEMVVVNRFEVVVFYVVAVVVIGMHMPYWLYPYQSTTPSHHSPLINPNHLIKWVSQYSCTLNGLYSLDLIYVLIVI